MRMALLNVLLMHQSYVDVTLVLNRCSVATGSIPVETFIIVYKLLGSSSFRGIFLRQACMLLG